MRIHYLNRVDQIEDEEVSSMSRRFMVWFVFFAILVEVVFGSFINVPVASAATKTTTVNFSESTDSTPTKTVNLPNATKINSVKVTSSTGGSATATLSGTTATVNAKGADVSRYKIDEIDPYYYSKTVTVKPDVNHKERSTVADTYSYPTDSSGYNDSKGPLPLARTYESELLRKTIDEGWSPSSGWDYCYSGGDCKPFSEVESEWEPYSKNLNDSNGKTFSASCDIQYYGGSLSPGSNYVSEPLKPKGFKYKRHLQSYCEKQLYKGEYTGKVYKSGRRQEDPVYVYTVELTYTYNTAPTISLDALPTEVNKSSSSSMFISGNVSDPEGDALTITYKAGTSTGTLTTVSSGSGSRSFSGYIPTSGFSTGTQTITVTASDGSLTDSDTKSLTISSNRTPTITIDSMSGYVNKSRESYFYVSGTTSDADGDALDIYWSAGGSSGLLQTVYGGSGTRYYSGYIPSYVLSGSTTVTMIATDKLASAVASRDSYGYWNSSPNVSVNALNSSYNMANVSSMNVSGYLSDSDADSVSLSYTFNGKTVSVGTYYPGYSSSYYSFNVPLSGVPNGNYDVRVDVSDGISSSSTRTNTTNLFTNDVPVITANAVNPAEYNVSRIKSVYVSGTVSDKEKDAVTVSYKFGKKAGTLNTYDTSSGVVEYSGYIPVDDTMDVGNYPIVLTAKDNTGSSSVNTNSIRVYHNTAPVTMFDTLEKNSFNTAHVKSVKLSGSVTDVDVGDEVTVSYNFRGVTKIIATGIATSSSMRFDGEIPIDGSIPDGDYDIKVSSNDGLLTGNVATQRVKLFTNNTPSISMDGLSGYLYSDKSGFNKIRLTGTINDLDPDDTLNVFYKIDNKVGKLQTLTGNGGDVRFDGSITIDGNVREGDRYVEVYVNDGLEDSNTVTSDRIEIDKSGPDVSIVSSNVDWTKNGIELTATARDVNGVKGVDVQKRTVSQNGNECFVFTDNLDNVTTKCMDVTNIDTTAPSVTVIRYDDTTDFKKSNRAVLNIVDTADSRTMVGSGVASVKYNWSKSKEFDLSNYDETTFNGVVNVVDTLDMPKDLSGTYYLHLRVTDMIGNVTDYVSTLFNVDNEAPVVDRIDFTNITNTSFKATGVANDALKGLHAQPYMYSIDGNVVTDWTGSYVAGSLTPNTEYVVKVRARDGLSNESVESKGYRVKTLASEVSAYVDRVGTNDVDVRIDAKDNPKGTEYQVERSDDSSFMTGKTTVMDWSTKTLLTDDTLVSGKTYYYRVRSRSVDVDGSDRYTNWSVAVRVVLKSEVPKLSLNAMTSTSSALNLDDRGNSSSVRYFMERSTDISFSKSVVVMNWSASSNVVTDVGLATGTDYFYRVRSRNIDGDVSDWSEVLRVKTLPASPSISSVVTTAYSSASVDKSLEIRWTDVTGSDMYDVYDNVSDKKVGSVGNGVGVFSVDKLDPNTRYDFYIVARNTSGVSGRSNVMGNTTRGHEPLSVDIKDTTQTTITFGLNATDRGTLSNQQLIVREKGKTAVVNTPIDVSNKLSVKTLRGLKMGVAYELWVKTTNDVGVSNGEVKLVDEFLLSRPPELVDRMAEFKYSEKSGYDKIKLVVNVNDVDMYPSPDKVKLYYTVRDKNGNVLKGHDGVLFDTVTTTGMWQSVSYGIPVDSRIGEGVGYTIDVKAVDSQGNEVVITTKPFLVDKSEPLGDLKLLLGPTKNSVTLGVDSIDSSISGSPINMIKFQKRVNNGEFKDQSDWSALDTLPDVGLENVSRYRYRALVRDNVNNVLTTNDVDVVTAPNIENKARYYLEDEPSAVVLDWGRVIDPSDGITVEVKRSGQLISEVTSGSRFVDKGLDYERSYEYELVTVTTDADGKRIESAPVKLKIDTGMPLLMMSIYGDYDAITKVYRLNRTLFSDEARIYGDVFYKQGGLVKVGTTDRLGKRSLDFDVRSAQSGKFLLKSSVVEDPYVMDVTANLLDSSINVPVVSKKVKFTIKRPLVESLDDDKYFGVYKK